MARVRITKREVDAARPPAAGEIKVWDCELQGFGLRVRAGEMKSNILQYRDGEGRTRRFTVGLCSRLIADEAPRVIAYAPAAAVPTITVCGRPLNAMIAVPGSATHAGPAAPAAPPAEARLPPERVFRFA